MKEITPEVIGALRELREAAMHSDEISHSLARAFNVLDETDVFDRIDEVADGKADVRTEDRAEHVFMVELVYYTVTDSKKTETKVFSTNVTTFDEEEALSHASAQLLAQLEAAGFLGDGVALVITGGTTNPSPL